MKEERYKLVKYYCEHGVKSVIKTGLTLKEALYAKDQGYYYEGGRVQYIELIEVD